MVCSSFYYRTHQITNSHRLGHTRNKNLLFHFFFSKKNSKKNLLPFGGQFTGQFKNWEINKYKFEDKKFLMHCERKWNAKRQRRRRRLRTEWTWHAGNEASFIRSRGTRSNGEAGNVNLSLSLRPLLLYIFCFYIANLCTRLPTTLENKKPAHYFLTPISYAVWCLRLCFLIRNSTEWWTTSSCGHHQLRKHFYSSHKRFFYSSIQFFCCSWRRVKMCYTFYRLFFYIRYTGGGQLKRQILKSIFRKSFIAHKSVVGECNNNMRGY